MSQIDMFTDDDPRWVGVREEAKLAVAVVTLKEFAYRCDASPSGIADSLAERDRKRLAAEHLVKLVDISPPANQLALIRQFAGPMFRVERAVVHTPEEEARITRDYVAANAPGLVPGLLKALGR